jgi:hypothetical protein
MTPVAAIEHFDVVDRAVGRHVVGPSYRAHPRLYHGRTEPMRRFVRSRRTCER